jgi:integrase
MPPRKLTVRLLEKLQPGERVRDTDARGLFAECGKAGAVALKFQADLRQGPRTGEAREPITIRLTLGTFPELTLDAARQRAAELRAQVRAGRDPRPGAPAPQGPASWTVARMRDEYVRDLEIRQKAARTIGDLQDMFSRYLADWLELPAGEITRAMARDRHARITVDNGPVAANYALRAFRTCFNFAKRVQDAPLGDNPAEAVTFHPQRSRQAVILFPDIPEWLAKVRKLTNPLRAAMHELGLFSGLRPGTLVALERAWLRLDERAIVVPALRMKARREFALPLSGHMVELIRHALAAGDVLFRGSPYLFPTRNSDGEVIATQVWKERMLRGETGHILRHTYSTLANAAGVGSANRMLLMGQKVPGIEGVYLQERALFEALRGEQERVTAHILVLN